MPENCPSDCPMAQRVIVLEESEKRHGETHKEIFKRINSLETENAVQDANHKAVTNMLAKMDEKNDKLVEKVESIKECVTAQLQTMNELNERGKQNRARLDALEAKPGKRWDGIVEKLIAGIVGAVATGIVGGAIVLLTMAGG